ncbi:MAG: GGDEF domain-containing protein [Burkholderiaceae bacterium]|nr:GGDEF domain-containing protein [Rhodoferax sp.]MCP5284147.1 GGDEF domain-containing protein [Burkholderiaceae bacterium]
MAAADGTPPPLPAEIAARLAESARLLVADPAAALATAEDALARLDALPGAEPAWRAQVLRAQGLALGHAGQARAGVDALRSALALLDAQDHAVRAQIERALSIVHDQLHALDDALAWAVRAAASARSAGDESLLADALHSCGVARSKAGDAEGGLANYREVLQLHEAGGRVGASISILNNIGINLKNLGRLDEAVVSLRRAQTLMSGRPEAVSLPLVQTNLAEPLWRLGRLDEAEVEIDAALSRLEPGGRNSHEANARWMRAEVLRGRGRSAEAAAELELALKASQRLSRVDTEANVQLSLCTLAAERGDHAAALAHHQAFHALDRRRLDEEAARRIQALTVQADLAHARHEAEVYRLRHGELAQAHDRLQALHDALLAADVEKSRLLERLAAQTRTDPLTGLANRRALDEHLAAEFARSRRLSHPLALAMCDLDNFKQINDRLGHATGDLVLRRTATLLRGVCRDIDVVARYGGEEFCLVFLEADLDAAQRACEAARAAVATHDWTAEHPALRVTLSIGVADAEDSADPATLLAQADRRLYEAKRAGKDRVVATG